jgi:hypothetical protein
MKTNSLMIFFIVLVLGFSSCKEITVTTKVNEDGSFTRTITVVGDSSDVLNAELPYPVDQTWQQRFEKDTTDTDDYVLTWSKTYNNSDALKDEIKRDTSWRNQLTRQIEIEKSFGFFYSYLNFKEVYKAVNLFTKLDYKKFFTDEDLDWISGQKIAVTANDSIRIEKADERVEAYLLEAITLEFIDILTIGIQELNDPALHADNVIIWKDSIKKKVDEWDGDKPEKFIDYYRDWTGIPEVDQLKNLESPAFGELAQKIMLLKKIIEMDTYKQNVEMPGLITETNSVSLKGNSVSWKFDPMPILFRDYEMVVESRVVNYWAFVVTGVILLLLIVLLIVKSFRK